MKFSVIIPVRKICEYTYEAIPYFKEQSYKDFEIIIVSEADEEKKFYKTKIIKVGRIPPAEKRNLGAKYAKGEILAFIDDDAYPEKDWLQIAFKNFQDKEIIAIGGPGLVPKNATFFQKISSKVYDLSSEKTGIRYKKGKKQEIDDWPTCNFFVRKNEFMKIGGFDSKYWGVEDTLLCHSLSKIGKKMIYNPELIVYHHPRRTLKQHLKQTFFWGMWRGFFIKKHLNQAFNPLFFIPSAFVIWLTAGGLISLTNRYFAGVYCISILLYFIYLIIAGIRTKKISFFIPVVFLMLLTHLSYGIGFLRGLFSFRNGPTKQTLNPSEKLKIGAKI